MNSDQRALSNWIAAGLAIPEVRALHGDAGYLLNNMIAKYSSAADTYMVSENALLEFKKMSVDLSNTYSRSTFYGKQSPFMYEHSIPVNVVRSILLGVKENYDSVRQILEQAGAVVVILRTEDNLLSNFGLSQKMPPGWTWGDDPLARYKKAGILISTQVLKVCGAICR